MEPESSRPFRVVAIIATLFKVLGTFQAYNIMNKYQFPSTVYILFLQLASILIIAPIQRPWKSGKPVQLQQWSSIFLYGAWTSLHWWLWCTTLERLHPLRVVVGENMEHFWLFLFAICGWLQQNSGVQHRTQQKAAVFVMFTAACALLASAGNLFNYEDPIDEGENSEVELHSPVRTASGIPLLLLMTALEPFRKNVKKKLDQEIGDKRVHLYASMFSLFSLLPFLLYYLYGLDNISDFFGTVLTLGTVSNIVLNTLVLCIIPFYAAAYATKHGPTKRQTSNITLGIGFCAAYVFHFLLHRHYYFYNPTTGVAGSTGGEENKPVRHNNFGDKPLFSEGDPFDPFNTDPTPYIQQFVLHIDNVLIVFSFLFMLAGAAYSEGQGGGPRNKRAGPITVDEIVDSYLHRVPLEKAGEKADKYLGLFEKIMDSESTKKLFVFLCMNFFFMFVELVVGLCAGSLGLIADAFHMLFDSASVGIALYAAYMTQWKATNKYPYGYHRWEVLSGFTNSVLLFFVAAYILVESIGRVFDPPEIDTTHLLSVSVGGFLINFVGVVFFHEAHHVGSPGGGCSHSGHGHSHGHSHSHGHNEEAGHAHHAGTNSNIKGVYLHICADLAGSIGVIISTILMRMGGGGFLIADPICSLILACLICVCAMPLVIETSQVLMQQAPDWFNSSMDRCIYSVLHIDGVVGIKDPHFWELSGSKREVVASFHIVVANDASENTILNQAKSIVKRSEETVASITIQITKQGDFNRASQTITTDVSCGNDNNLITLDTYKPRIQANAHRTHRKSQLHDDQGCSQSHEHNTCQHDDHDHGHNHDQHNPDHHDHHEHEHHSHDHAHHDHNHGKCDHAYAHTHPSHRHPHDHDHSHGHHHA